MSWSTAAARPPERPTSGGPGPADTVGEPDGRAGRPGRPLLLGVALGAVLAVVLLGGMDAGLGAGPRSSLEPPVLDGSAGYRFIHIDDDTSLPSRFDPCRPVPFVVNPAGAPLEGVEDVQEAFRRAELATGIRFVYEGEVDEVPARDRPPYQPDRYGERWAPVLVGWVAMDPAEGERVKGAVVGWAHTPILGGRGQDVVTTGTIALDAYARSVRPGFGAGRRWGNVLLHEVGHLLGLDHTEERGEVMAATVDRGAGRWGPGDLAGLAHLGRQAGCLPLPTPGQVDLSS